MAVEGARGGVALVRNFVGWYVMYIKIKCTSVKLFLILEKVERAAEEEVEGEGEKKVERAAEKEVEGEGEKKVERAAEEKVEIEGEERGGEECGGEQEEGGEAEQGGFPTLDT